MSSIIIPPLGWKPFEERTDAENMIHNAIVARMPSFSLPAMGKPEVGTKVLFTDLWRHPKALAALGFDFIGWHQFTGSCFPAGTPVRMADGSEMPIEEVRCGHSVVSHLGRSQSVSQVMNRKFTGSMVKINVSGYPFPLEMTEDHQVATVPSSANWRWTPDDYVEWKYARDITTEDRVLIGWNREVSPVKQLDVAELLGDKCMIMDDLMSEGKGPVSNIGMAQYICNKSGLDWRGKVKLRRSRYKTALVNRFIPLCDSLARLIGLYLAEGGCDSGKVVFTFSDKEEHLAAEVIALVKGFFGVSGKMLAQKNRPTVLKAVFNSTTLEAILKALVPGNVYSKRVPACFMNACESTKLALLNGWMDGDGHTSIKGDKEVRITGVTVSPLLARDFTELALSCGLRATCTRRKAYKQSKVAYSVDLSGKKAVQLCSTLADFRATRLRNSDTDTRRTRFGYARKVRSVESRDVVDVPVFDFEVREDHSFIANGMVVHNCVGVGGGNAAQTLIMIDALIRNELEKIILYFWPYNYGRSRLLGGMRGEGEGSFGSTFSQSLEEDGGTAWLKELGCPDFTIGNGMEIGARAERTWSDGNEANAALRAEGVKHKFISAPLSSGEQVRDAIMNGYPVTRAFSTFVNPETATVRNGVLLGRYNGRGGHQESWLGYWHHPQNGELIYEMNQWGLNAYGKDPGGGADGGCWLSIDEVDRQCQNGEIYALSQYEGYPAQPDIPKLMNWGDIWS